MSSTRQARDDPGRASAILTIITVLPEIANQLQSAVNAFAHTRQLWSPERNLLAYEEPNEVAVQRPTIGVPQYRDLERLINTLQVAGTLTTALAADLALVAPARMPDIAGEHATNSAANGALSPMALCAHDAARRAHLAVQQEWAVPETRNSRRSNPATSRPR